MVATIFSILVFMGLGGAEIFLILAVFIILFGAKKIPELARGLGKGIREFKDATSGIKKELEDEIKDIKPKDEDLRY